VVFSHLARKLSLESKKKILSTVEEDGLMKNLEALPHPLVIISTTTKSVADLLLEIKHAAEIFLIIVRQCSEIQEFKFS